MLGFIAASAIGTLYLQHSGDKAHITTVNDLRTWSLIFAFVVALGLAVVLFGNFEIG